MKQKQLDTQKLRQDGTGMWLLDGEIFIYWQDNPGVLWIQGTCEQFHCGRHSCF
jgi:hypothetical protein